MEPCQLVELRVISVFLKSIKGVGGDQVKIELFIDSDSKFCVHLPPFYGI